MEKTLIANPIRRLKKAIANPKIEADMDLEDDVIEEFNQQEKRLEKAIEEKETERERAEAEYERAETERERAENAIKDKETMIHNLAKMGLRIEDIANAANTTVEAVKTILK
jgi:chromosome segregation ATPase